MPAHVDRKSHLTEIRHGIDIAVENRVQQLGRSWGPIRIEGQGKSAIAPRLITPGEKFVWDGCGRARDPHRAAVDSFSLSGQRRARPIIERTAHLHRLSGGVKVSQSLLYAHVH